MKGLHKHVTAFGCVASVCMRSNARISSEQARSMYRHWRLPSTLLEQAFKPSDASLNTILGISLLLCSHLSYSTFV